MLKLLAAHASVMLLNVIVARDVMKPVLTKSMRQLVWSCKSGDLGDTDDHSRTFEELQFHFRGGDLICLRRSCDVIEMQ